MTQDDTDCNFYVALGGEREENYRSEAPETISCPSVSEFEIV